jgi:hypothetical protein
MPWIQNEVQLEMQNEMRAAGGNMSLIKRCWLGWLRRGMLAGLTAWSVIGAAQEPANVTASVSPSASDAANTSLSESVRELREQVRDLQATVAGMRRELDQVRTGSSPQTALLREAVLTSPAKSDAAAGSSQNNAQQSLSADNLSENQIEIQKDEQKKSERTASLDEEYQLLSGKVDDQYQTKVESASKYRVRLSGIVLMNLFSNQGVVDSIDLPTVAYAPSPGYSSGSFGATLRQSEIGFETFGPTVAGAKTRADLQLDLAGGFPEVPNGTNYGLVRLRTATMRMDWTNTSLVVGQDAIFFSPNSPTSFASLAIPALTYAGNLWSWMPQIRIEHRVVLGEESSLLFQGGILDPVSGEVPGAEPGQSPGTGYYREAGPGEASRQPAYGTRVAWTHSVFGQPMQVGVGGFYSRQNYGFGRNADGWAAMTDVDLPLSSRVSLSGKFYRGRAIGGLYGAFGQSVLFNGDPTSASTQIEALNSMGGWAQLKYRPASKWEFNAAFGIDNPYAGDLKYFPYAVSYGDAALARNQGSFLNMIYRPRSDLLFSAEYRHLTTYSLLDGGNSAGHLNLMMGVLF